MTYDIATDQLGSIKSRFVSAYTRYLKKTGVIQDYIEFMSCEIDPLFSRRRTAADVVNVKRETKNTVTLTLKPYRQWSGFVPGQYISVEVEVNGVRLKRNYSISSSERFFRDTGCFDITVKEVQEGRVSTYLNRTLTVRDVLCVSPAAGSFTATEYIRGGGSLNQSILFIAAGSGITPAMSMIEDIKEHNPALNFKLIYHVLSENEVVFAQRLSSLASLLPNFTFLPHYTNDEGFISPEQLRSDCADIADRAIFLCGPPGFMDAVISSAADLGVKSEQIKQESFGSSFPALRRNSNANAKGTVHFFKSGKQVLSQGDKTLLELAELVGLNPKFGCRNGICFECKCQRGVGSVMNTITGKLIPEDQIQIQACISVPVGDVSINDL